MHAGQVTVVDGTEAAGRRAERVMRCDPGLGVARHVDAGYPEAIEFASSRQMRLPLAGRGHE
jgi:urocanate hydratase